ncbi:6-carboxytetrahydropterin synthase [Caproiciproducens galactitolivorans]|uniref:6-carboxy-5,6,7,8-tetrahydropterin synthase n=1 Tax=Caproiciproducens galactitolivorans TaxID=642589 RepID=A0ABT4BTX4_9FIRM|nr:6-carboxytetrahydropterin synthase [Caproiciproducens galactitolivorans]MCY1714346.1 6-carboxytetrahydropterin synthase [Caproiciproducens galactitolivorans]
MGFEQYKFKFYLNANHAIQINGHSGQVHPHTWEISIVTVNTNDNFVRFNDMEAIVDKLFDKYQDRLINEAEPFDRINPTLENMCEVFKDEIDAILKSKGWELRSIEVSETPARSYVMNYSDGSGFERKEQALPKPDKALQEQRVTDIINEYLHPEDSILLEIRRMTEKGNGH